VRRAGRILQWTVNLGVVAVLIAVFAPVGERMGRPLIAMDPPAKADWIVVLGGNDERVAEAADLYRQGWAGKVIVSSTAKDVPGMKRVARECGVAEADLLLDANAVGTRSHPHTVAALSGVDPKTQRFLVVTSLYHTSRAKAVFARAGYADVRVCPPRWQSLKAGSIEEDSVSRAATLSTKLYEYLAWAMYRIRGWV
jgi:uncharacterized SAM-binding protein YcdF (DUF218 family)